jgi:proline dehydrogenase
MDDPLRKALRTASGSLRGWLTRAYAAGPELSDAVRACQTLARQGRKGTVGYWPGDEDTPKSVAATYVAAIRALAAEKLDCTISIKLPPLAFDRDLVAGVIGAAKEADVGVHFDSRALDATDRTLELIVESAQQHGRIGCTLPGRWRRSLRDADLAVGLGVNVRVVKGQWEDPDQPDVDQRDGFMAVIDRLAGRARGVGVATHDPVLARAALGRLKEAGTPCELELLFGLPMRAVAQVARELGVGSRIYVPYGHSWVPYALSWARRNPRIVWWVFSDAVFGRFSHSVK